MHICYKMCLLFLHFIHSRTFEQKAEENKIGWKKYGQCIITFTTCQQCFQCFANWFPYVVHWTGLIWQWLNDIILLEWEFNSVQFNAIMPSTINHHQTGSRHLKINFWSNIYVFHPPGFKHLFIEIFPNNEQYVQIFSSTDRS